MAIEYYDRDLCIDNTTCEEGFLNGMKTILDNIEENQWYSERGRIDNFIENGVHFWIRQEQAIPKIYVMMIMANLRGLEQEHGIREITQAGFLSFGTLMADFTLTFPWD